MRILTLLPWTDWLAVVAFLAIWIGYAAFARYWSSRRASLISTSNRLRHRWMLQATGRDPRMIDGIVAQSLAQTPAFFSSTSIIIIGGLFALLGTTERAAELVRDIPFAVPTTQAVFEIKVFLLIAIFVYAFFRFTWSMRQYTYVTLTIASMPPAAEFEKRLHDREAYAHRAGAMATLAIETFNDGVRAYYFAFAAISWFFSPVALVLGSTLVAVVLYLREFRSNVLAVLNE